MDGQNKAAEALVRKIERKLDRAILAQDWQAAAHLSAYLAGMRQIIAVYNPGFLFAESAPETATA